MIRLLYSFFIFSCLTLTSCSQVEVGSTSVGSTAACAGEGGIVPLPPVPESLETQNFASSKFLISSRAFDWTKNRIQIFNPSTLIDLGEPSVPSLSSFVAVVDEVCLMDSSGKPEWFSERTRGQVVRQESLSRARAYSIKIGQEAKLSEVKKWVDEDQCLIQVSEDSVAEKFYTPDDTRYSDQMHLPAINASTGWDTFYTGLSGETVVAIIDDGIELTHDDLKNVLWVNTDEVAGNGIDDDGNGYVDDVNGYNFASSIGSPAQQAGSYHGTHVSGLAAGQGGNSTGITGVMGRNVKIMALNVFGTSATTSAASIINAINYARQNGAHVINMSLGGSGTASTVNTAMQTAVSAGVFIAVSAGNSNIEITEGNFVYPAGYAKDISGAVAVGSVDARTLAKSSFSNYSSSYVEITAPGSDSVTGGVLSTYTSNTYQYLQGTSMSGPVVAGAAALFIGWARSQGATPTPAQVETYLRTSASAKSNLSSYVSGGALLDMASLASSANCDF